MKNKMFTLAAFALTLVGGGAMIASNAIAKSPAPAATTSEKHPELRKALRQLEAAMKTMHDASWDFGGHKVDAMKDTQKAIDELHQAMKFDKH